MFFKSKPQAIPSAADCLPGRDEEMAVTNTHFVNKQALRGPFPSSCETIYLGMGCFWGAERLFWLLEGVHVTAVGYQGGHTPNPTYAEVCTGRTGHTEAVMVVFDASIISLEMVLKVFWEEHDPTQGMRQGNDSGTQYRSAIYTTSDTQAEQVAKSADLFASALKAKGLGPITSEIATAKTFYFAESEHQQYLAKNPGGYCGLAGTGVSCPVGIATMGTSTE